MSSAKFPLILEDPEVGPKLDDIYNPSSRFWFYPEVSSECEQSPKEAL